ncbi:hypothetical protein M409DRAFT_58286 [Zasmidium cellare ATCC 36951]|uniref:Uncharacterized protein n=1 Tax=Zasmidium cellare ATCC 36951 TaxID=1080233 RepID=A0A6A6C8H9_ZASCE|nr:uncharacterized protein M409DRAFT_58286 [Zasmidium cellare ATCC 36951]KAF2162540.1 hypothetical protein M409DRAFT_58286 [Zasmidium cellare ATCC 36951]
MAAPLTHSGPQIALLVMLLVEGRAGGRRVGGLGVLPFETRSPDSLAWTFLSPFSSGQRVSAPSRSSPSFPRVSIRDSIVDVLRLTPECLQSRLAGGSFQQPVRYHLSALSDLSSRVRNVGSPSSGETPSQSLPRIQPNRCPSCRSIEVVPGRKMGLGDGGPTQVSSTSRQAPGKRRQCSGPENDLASKGRTFSSAERRKSAREHLRGQDTIDHNNDSKREKGTEEGDKKESTEFREEMMERACWRMVLYYIAEAFRGDEKCLTWWW